MAGDAVVCVARRSDSRSVASGCVVLQHASAVYVSPLANAAGAWYNATGTQTMIPVN